MGTCVADVGRVRVADWVEQVYDTGMVMTELETVQHRIETRIAQVCGHLNVLHAELVALTAESLTTQAWCGQGIISAAQWVAWQTGVSPERAQQIVQIAQRASELPVTYTAFSDGLLSIDQIAVVAKRAPALNDREACDLALNATVAQLRVGLSKHFFPPTPDPAVDRRAG